MGVGAAPVRFGDNPPPPALRPAEGRGEGHCRPGESKEEGSCTAAAHGARTARRR